VTYPYGEELRDWIATGAEPDEVTVQLQTLIDAGADSVVLVPFSDDVAGHFQVAAAEVVPYLVRS
jgi:hypothetical protein